MFLIAFFVAIVVLRLQAEQHFTADLARDADRLTAVIEAEAQVTSDRLGITSAFVRTADPTNDQWTDFLESVALSEGSWLKNVVLIRPASRDGLDALVRHERAAGMPTFTAQLPNPTADEYFVVTRLTPGMPDGAVGLDIGPLPGVGRELENSRRTSRPILGHIPAAARRSFESLATRYEWDLELSPLSVLVPISESPPEGAFIGWLAGEISPGARVAEIASRAERGLSIAGDSSFLGGPLDEVVLAGDPNRRSASAAESRFTSAALAGSVQVWSSSGPSLTAYEVLLAAVIGVSLSLASALLMALGRRARTISRRLSEWEREIHVDALTGLANRSGIERALRNELDQSRRHGDALGVLLLDVDRFKVVNDSLGHPVGDELLRAVGERLRRGVAGTDVVGRFGGDEFVIVCPGLADLDDAVAIGHRLAACLHEPVALGERMLSVSASIGVAHAAPGEVASADALIRDADAAMYEAKRSGHEVQRFDASMRRQALERLAMEEAVVEALASDRLRVEYQPVVSLQTGALVGLEALVRLEHSAMGVVPPDRFLPVAREVGLMNEIGERVLRRALTEARRWNEMSSDLPPLPISVNLAESQAEDPAFATLAKALLDEYEISASQLVLELPEDALVERLEECIPVLEQLAAFGIRLSIDDFGTGRSSLAHLRVLSFVAEVKIDRMFVGGLGAGGSDREIVGAIVDLAAALDADVVAEGVETVAQWDQLREMGVPRAQGFLISRPRPPRALDAWVQDRSSVPLAQNPPKVRPNGLPESPLA